MWRRLFHVVALGVLWVDGRPAFADALHGDLLVSSGSNGAVLLYDGATGSFKETFASGAGLQSPQGLAFGADGNLYVANQGAHQVLRFDGNTGSFIDIFVPTQSGGLLSPHDLTFGPDGNLYVAGSQGDVRRYNGTTGAFIDIFTSGAYMPLSHGLVFGLDGNLYVSNMLEDVVLRYDGVTGAFIDVFASGGSLSEPIALTFGLEGDLFLTSAHDVFRYDGATGDFIDVFATGAESGSTLAHSLIFGPGDDPYLTFWSDHTVQRFDGATGDYIGPFVPSGSGGLDTPRYLVFVPQRVTIETVTVGNPGNTGEPSGEGAGGFGATRICGAVDYVYSVGKFEVTAGQYTQFLNAVAATDTYGLYDPAMADPTEWTFGCSIQRSGSSGSYSYSVAPDWADRPVNWVSWGDAARFANWLHNGQPTGSQDLTTTEDGSYYLNGAIGIAQLMAVVRQPDATWVIPSEDEWYKAAYHKNEGVTGHYWDYPTQSDTPPTAEAPPGADMANGSANYRFDYPNGFVDPTYHRTEVGAYDAMPSHSAYGTYDQAGNVAEWSEAVIEPDRNRGVRGGSFISISTYAMHAADRLSGRLPTDEDEDYDLGFRVADVTPTGACCTSQGCELLTEAQCAELDTAKYNGDGTVCEDVCPAGIPAVSEWGLVAMTLLVLTAGTLVLTKRRAASAA